MRLEGALKSWNAERGIGVIAPVNGGEDIHVHIKAFKDPKVAPEVGQRLSFELGVNWEGKMRARHVRVMGGGGASGGLRWPGAHGGLGFIVLPLFGVLLALVHWRWHLPWWIAAVYLAASLLCYGIHGLDRRAATRSRWRVSEPVLLLLGVAGGWPGAVLAHQLLPLDGIRPAYRALFWLGAVANMVGLVLLTAAQSPAVA